MRRAHNPHLPPLNPQGRKQDAPYSPEATGSLRSWGIWISKAPKFSLPEMGAPPSRELQLRESGRSSSRSC